LIGGGLGGFKKSYTRKLPGAAAATYMTNYIHVFHTRSCTRGRERKRKGGGKGWSGGSKIVYLDNNQNP